MRTPIYPDIEAFIRTKKLKKYESQQQEAASEIIENQSKRKKGNIMTLFSMWRNNQIFSKV